MLKLILALFCLAVILLACERKSEYASEVDKVVDIQKNLSTKSQDSALIYLKTAQQLLEGMKVAPDSIRAENNYLLGLHFQKLGKMDSAAIYFHNAISFVNDTLYRKRPGNYFRDAYNTYLDLGRYGDCLLITQKFRSLLNPDTLYSSITWANHWEQKTHLSMGEYKKALKISDAQIKFTREKDPQNLPTAMVERATLNYFYLKDKPSALSIIDSLIGMEDQLTENFKSQAYGNKGMYLYLRNDYEEALSNYTKASQAAKKDTARGDYINALAVAYNNIAEVSIDLKSYDMARKYLDSVRKLGLDQLSKKSLNSLLRYELRLASETNKGQKRVFAIMDSINSVQDKAYKIKIENELQELTKKTEEKRILGIEKQQTEIENIKLENRNLIFLVTAGLLGIIGFLFYQRRNLKFEKQNLQTQQRLLRSQMNPHFTFNTLYAIQYEIKKDQEGARNYLLKFSRLLRLVLENSTQNYVQIEKELEALRKYMDLQLVRIPTRFSYQIHFNNFEEDELIFIPPMLLQPFVENSIDHGFNGIDYIGKIDIYLSLQDKFIECVIEDNGRGIEEPKSLLKNSTSVRLISEFLKKATKTEIQITNKRASLTAEQTGVKIKFLIPFRLTEDD